MVTQYDKAFVGSISSGFVTAIIPLMERWLAYDIPTESEVAFAVLLTGVFVYFFPNKPKVTQ